MTETEKAIAFFQHKAAMKRAAGYAEAGHYDLALSALREKQERENPKPLTLDELRDRNGKPIYIVSKEFGDSWEIASYDKRRFFGRGLCYWLDDYGKTWLAYDHEPKEAQG